MEPILPNGSHREHDDLLAIRPDENQNAANLLYMPVLVLTVGTLSHNLGFCWWLRLMSFSVTYYCIIFVSRSCFRRPPRGISTFEGAMLATKTLFYLIGLVVMVYLCISMTPAQIFIPTAVDIWTPYEVHDALRMTEVMYDPGHNATIDIFAIHGLGSKPENAWTYRSNETEVRWLSELLPQTKGFQDARIVLVNHQSRWESNTAVMELGDYASALLEHIESQHKANPNRPIIFIAHSFGGLLLKKALLLAKSRSREVAAMTKGIIFLGVPHRGSYAALVASCLSCMASYRGSSSKVLEFMSVDAPAILDLESEFYDAYVLPYHPFQPQPYICDVLEMRPERMGNLVLGSIVRPKYGLLRHGRVFTLDTDHRGLNKFHSQDDPNFHIFVRILLQARTYALQPNPFLDVPIPGSHHLSNEGPTNLPDVLDFASYGMPWTTRDRLTALVLGGLQEFAASWLADYRNAKGGYFSGRVFNTALYACFVGVSICQALSWPVLRLFEGCTSFETRMLQIIISNITIVPIRTALDQAAMALIAGARNWYQVRATVRAGLMPALMISWALSPICILFARVFLRPQIWDGFFHAVYFLSTTYVNALVKKKRLAALRKRYESRQAGTQDEVTSNVQSGENEDNEQEEDGKEGASDDGPSKPDN